MKGSVITIGTFDGVHRGHQTVIDLTRRVAESEGLRPLAVTFDRHPLLTVAPHRAPRLIMEPECRNRLLESLGVEVVELEFSPDVCAKSCAQMIAGLKRSHNMKKIVLGYDNTFGCDGVGKGFDFFRRQGQAEGVEVLSVPCVEGFSSSAVRNAVASGDMPMAHYILGRPFSIRGIVSPGRRIGRTIGVPTANLIPDPRIILPAPGVYAADVHLPDGAKRRAVVNVGANPTVSDSGEIRIEAHIPGWHGDLYNKEISVDFLRRLRGEKRFPSLSALQQAIRADIAEALLHSDSSPALF